MESNRVDQSNGANIPAKCQSVQRQFTLLLDDELQDIKAWWIWRHIDNCSVCRTELAAVRRLDRELHKADIVPEAVKEQLKEIAERYPKRTIRKRGISWGWAALVPAVAIGTVAAQMVVKGRENDQMKAFHQFELVNQAILQTTSAHWVETSKRCEPGTEIVLNQGKQEWWVRTDPPTRKSQSFPQSNPSKNINTSSLINLEPDSTFDVIETADERRTFQHSNKTVQVAILSQQQDKTNRVQALRQQIQQQLTMPIPDKGHELGDSPKTISWSSEKTMLNGKPVLKLTRRDVFREKGERANYWMEPAKGTLEVWVGESDHLPVRFDMRDLDENGKVINEWVREQISFNVPVDTAFVSLAPPNTPVFHDEHQGSIPTQIKLSEEDQKAITDLMSQAERDWYRGDWDAFASMWDFDYVGSLPHSFITADKLKDYLRRQTLAHGNSFLNGVWSQGAIGGVSYVRQEGFGDVDLPEGKPLLIRTDGYSTGYYPDRRQMGMLVYYTLRREGPNRFRIVGRYSEGSIIKK